MIADRKELREWMFRGLMFESESSRFREAGILVGANQEASEKTLITEALGPFGIDLRNEALRMARVYSLLFCFENSVRALIRERLEEKHGPGWMAPPTVTKKVCENAANRLADAEKNSWLEGEKKDLLSFTDFKDLCDIITNAWDDFADLIPTQHWIRQRMEELEKARNFIAHNRTLSSAEFQRIEMYIADWNKVVGL